MKQGRLQFRHYEGVFDTREKAYRYLEDIVNSAYAEENRLDKSLVAEPIVVIYKDANDNKQALLCIGVEGEMSDNTLVPYHFIDSAKLEEDIQAMSGETGGIEQEIQDEIARAMAAEEALQTEINITREGAGLEPDGSYAPETAATYVNDATSLKDADTKLDAELARVEQARKDVTGQDTDVYVPNENLVSRPIAYIDDAESLNDADVKLDEAIQNLDAEVVKNINVNGVDGVVSNNVASVNVSGGSIPIGEYEEYSGRADIPHPIHDDYSVLEAVKQLDTNEMEFRREANEKIDGLHLVKVTTSLDSNVREAYDLVNKDGLVQPNSDRILIYKDSSLYNVYLGHTDDRLDDYSSPVVTPGTGDTALCFIYLKENGLYELVCVNVEAFLQESEFKDGLRVDNHQVYVKIDETSEGFLTVSLNGVKISGVQQAIADAVQVEEERAFNRESAILTELNRTEAGAGLNGDGTYKQHNTQAEGMAYITDATSIDDATMRLDRSLQSEVARATDSENAISNTVNEFSANTVGEVARLDGKIDDEITRVEDKLSENERVTSEAMNQLKAELDRTEEGAGLNGDGTYNPHNIIGDMANYIADAESLDEADVLLDSALKAEETRATDAENAISSATRTFINETVSDIDGINNAIAAETARAEGAENSLDTRVDAIEAVVVNGEKAINVSAVGATENKLITLVLDDDNVLSQSNNGLRTNLSISYDNANQKVQLLGINGALISQFDSSDFIKDGMISAVTFDPLTNILTITWNTVAGHDSTRIDLSSLVDVYTVDSDSQKYLLINDYVLSAKVNVTDGLAGYNKLLELSGNVQTLESSWETPGSYKHDISDLMVTNPAAGSALETGGTLMRHYFEEGEKKYYVSNDAKDMVFSGQALSTVLSRVQSDVITLSGSSQEEINRLDTKIEDETDRATAAENSISGAVNDLQNQLDAANATISALTTQLETLSGIVETMEEHMADNIYATVKAILEGTSNEIKITANDATEKLTIGFADDAIFGQNS